MLATVFDVEKLKNEEVLLKTELSKPEVYSDFEKSNSLSKKLNDLSKIILNFNQAETGLKDLNEYLLLINQSATNEDILSFEQELRNITELINKLYLESLYSGENDSCDVLMEIHSGAGGEEAQDWAEMLERMYFGYADVMGYSVSLVFKNMGDGAGFKSAGYIFKGRNAYGNLKNERGVHRLVRISPFDSGARRHTSFASVLVSPEVDLSDDITIRPEDLKVDTYRSSGAGGQHVNKTESAIRITHLPTGIVVACQNERSQIQNREMAMKMLYGKLKEKQIEENERKINSINGQLKKIEWGSQIRSYVFCPYTLVKDHRTNFETSDIASVMNGDIQGFINDYLVKAYR